jgi:hypothetical protein
LPPALFAAQKLRTKREAIAARQAALGQVGMLDV